MIDVGEEIKKYSYIELDSYVDNYCDDVDSFRKIFEKIGSDIEKIGKLQYKASGNAEEVVELLDEMIEANKEHNILYDEVVNSLKQSKEKAADFLKSLIAVVDLFDQVYTFSKTQSNESWTNQLELQQENINEVLMRLSICRMDKGEGIFDASLHTAIKTDTVEKCRENEILEVVKCGFIYEGRVIRKAEVVINKKI